jgi:hypothetical protein
VPKHKTTAKFLFFILVLTLGFSLLTSCETASATTPYTTEPTTTSVPTQTYTPKTIPITTTPATTVPTTTAAVTTQATTIPATTISALLPDPVLSYLTKTDREIFVGFENKGKSPSPSFTVEMYATCAVPKARSPVKKLVSTLVIDALPVDGSVKKSFSIDDLVVTLKQYSNNLAGNYNFEVSIDSSGAMKESDETNNKTTINNIALARAPLPELAYDLNKVYTASDLSALLNVATNGLDGKGGPLAMYKQMGLDLSKVTIQIEQKTTAKEIYDKAFGTNSSWGFRSLGFCQTLSGGRQRILLSEGILPQIASILGRESGVALYAQKNPEGLKAGIAVGANELFAGLSQWCCVTYFAEKGMHLDNFSYEVNNASWDYFLEGNLAVNKHSRALWAIAAKLGYPNGGVPSDVLLKEMDYFMSLKDPTDYATKLYNEPLNKDAIKSTIYWKAADKPQTMLTLETTKRITDNPESITTAVSVDLVKVSQDNILYPPRN